MAKAVVPKILNLSTPTIRNQRTLIWLQDQNTSVNWSKWDAVVIGIDSYNYWSQYQIKLIGLILIETNYSFFEDLSEISKKIPMILITQKILDLKSEQYWAENYDNVLNLDTITEHYPFINTAWDGTAKDAIAILALLCRYNRIIDCTVTDVRAADLLGNITITHGLVPNETWLFTQFFKPQNSHRFEEIKQCLMKNYLCPHIDRIVLINEKDYSDEFNTIAKGKIRQIVSGKRLMYSDFLKYVRDEVPSGVNTMLCNADIYFGDSLVDLHKINMENRMFGLLRWDVDITGESKLFGPRADSQDTWIFLSDSIKSRKWDYSKFAFQLGQAGCDNAFAGHILRQKFLISNPAMSFKTYHLHNTDARTYNKNDYIRTDVYINIVPTNIIDTKQEDTPSTIPVIISNELASFEVKSSSMSNEITYCTMLEKDRRYKWEPSVENHYFEAAIPVYLWNNACVTPNGLVYDLYHIYKGVKPTDNDDRFNYWENANVDILTPLQKRCRMFAFPFKNTDVFKHPDTYILNYISRCVRFLKQYPDTSFWIPKQFAEYMEYFEWSNNGRSFKQLDGAYFDENTACWANQVIGLLPSQASLELGIEDIAALRSIFPTWSEKPSEKLCAVVISGAITLEFAEKQITQFLQNNDEEWSIRYVHEADYVSYDSLLGASLCIFIGGQNTNTAWAKLWALPKTCCVIEFQQELQIDGEFQHLAHVAGFKPWILLLSKGTVVDIQEQIMEQLGKWFKKNAEHLWVV